MSGMDRRSASGAEVPNVDAVRHPDRELGGPWLMDVAEIVHSGFAFEKELEDGY